MRRARGTKNWEKLLIEPPAGEAMEGKEKKKLSDVRVSYLLNNYANKAICRHETFPSAFRDVFSFPLSPFFPNSDFIIQLHIVRISRSFFFLFFFLCESPFAVKGRKNRSLI